MSGRVALITGGSRGIGKTIAKALIRDGCRVAILDVDQESLASCEAELGKDGPVKAILGDVTSREEEPQIVVPLADVMVMYPGGSAEEVEKIAKFIADIDSRIPYTLLAFYPQYIMNDLPTTSRRQAYECYEIAKKYLENSLFTSSR